MVFLKVDLRIIICLQGKQGLKGSITLRDIFPWAKMRSLGCYNSLRPLVWHVTCGFISKENLEEPIEEMNRPCPLPISTWSEPSTGVLWWTILDQQYVMRGTQIQMLGLSVKMTFGLLGLVVQNQTEDIELLERTGFRILSRQTWSMVLRKCRLQSSQLYWRKVVVVQSVDQIDDNIF